MDKEQLLEHCYRLLADMFVAERCLNCEKVLSEKFANEEEIIHRAFFELARHSFLYTGTIILCKTFEGISKNNKPLSIEQIFRWIECTFRLTTKQSEQFEKLRNEYSNQGAIVKLKTQRDKFYAHNDKISPEDFVDENGLTRSEKLELIHFALRVLSFAIGICTDNTGCFIVDNDESIIQLKDVLTDLEQYHHVAIPWIEEQWKRSKKMPNQRLELTWIGKGEEPAVEPRILLHDADRDYGDQNAENMLIHGDNLLALKALEQEYAGQVKCVYIDPPYNTGAAFEHYDDGLEHSTWLSLIKPRLQILWNLLHKSEGSIWISIDDSEQAYMRILCDELFGRSNFIAQIVWQKRYSRENREAIGDVHEYIIVYAKSPLQFKQSRNLVPMSEEQAKVYYK